MLSGWELSQGMKREVEAAQAWGKSREYITPKIAAVLEMIKRGEFGAIDKFTAHAIHRAGPSPAP